MCMRLCTCIYVCMYVCVYNGVCVCVYACMIESAGGMQDGTKDGKHQAHVQLF